MARKWWNVSSLLNLSYEKVYLSDQMIAGGIEQLEAKALFLKNNKMVEKLDGLFAVVDWATPQDAAEHDRIIKKIDKLKKNFIA